MSITKETILAVHEKNPRRVCFRNRAGGKNWTGLQTNKDAPTFSVRIKSAKKMFEADTGLVLQYSPSFDNYWMYVNDDQIAQIENWERAQGCMLYLRDCLSVSIALDINLIDNESRQYTEIGLLEHNGKSHRDNDAIKKLAGMVLRKIRCLHYYKDVDLICSVPSQDEEFHLPRSVTSIVGEEIDKQVITGGFFFDGVKASVRTTAFDEKWKVWEDAQVSFRNSGEFNVNGKTVILIDDKYQSGITIQYIAMKLQQAGAREIYGLSFVKTLGDRDNLSRDG